jgi:HCOMODA/2-hydroxy-3-carboxy-muconic semialdehyde decarboxylase
MQGDTQEIEALVTAYKILVNEGVLDGFGHISIRSLIHPDRFFMPRAMPPSLVAAEDLVELDVMTSQPVDPRGRRVNGERYLHGEIYKARTDVNAIIHSHSLAVIPLTIARISLQPVIVQAGFMPLEVPTFEIRDVRGTGVGMQITDMPRGAALAKTLGQSPVALLRGHGNVIVGTSIKQATVFAIYTEINARVQLQALSFAREIMTLDEPELFGPADFDINRPWEHYRLKMAGDAAKRSVDRAQFGLDQTQKPV